MQGAAFVGGLDAFADDLDAQFLAHRNGAADDGLAWAALVDAADQVHVQLDDVRLEVGQQVEPGKARTEVVEGTSALFAVTEEGNLDRLGERWRGVDHKLIHTNLTDAERSTLLETFGGD